MPLLCLTMCARAKLRCRRRLGSFLYKSFIFLQHYRTLYEKTAKMYNNGVSRESHLLLWLFLAHEPIRPNDGHAIAKSRRSSMWDHCVATNMASSWGGKHTRCIFFNHNAICERFYSKFAKLTIDSPASMAKLAIDRASIVFIKKKSGDFHSKSVDREIFIISSKIGRSPEKSGDLEALQPILQVKNCRSKINVEKDTTN